MYVCDRLFLARRPSAGTGRHGPLKKNIRLPALPTPPPTTPRPGRPTLSPARPPEGAHPAAEGPPERAADNAQEGAVLVTGASRGIGRAVAARLMADGLQVF